MAVRKATYDKTVAWWTWTPLTKAGEKAMLNRIKKGTILIAKDVVLPGSLHFESQPYSNGWKLVKNLDGHQLERKICDAGWNFFYMAGEVNASAFGFNGVKALSRAINQVLANLKPEKFNSLEITRVTEEPFLGLRRVTVSAHARHIQKSISLFQDERPAERERAKLAIV